jgi:FtsH-binding integral membrane protein
VRITAFLRKVYGWLFVGLGITTGVAFAVAGSPTLVRAIFGNPILLIAMVVGFFWKAPALQFVISVVGVLVFTGLTAWDAQKLKMIAAVTPDNQVGGRAVVGALRLYLDFVNLFLFLLRFLGGRRD